MGKYSDLRVDVLKPFTEVVWTDLNIPTYPSSSVPSNATGERITLTPIPSETSVNRNSVGGLLMVQIYTKQKGGHARAWAIADLLDDNLLNKSFSSGVGVTQFRDSSLNATKPDRDDDTLFMTSYSIPFKHYGVS
ncbi:hypothetical protein N9112_00115 [bacterium]|nr:hypothetical protein [bacterium]